MFCPLNILVQGDLYTEFYAKFPLSIMAELQPDSFKKIKILIQAINNAKQKMIKVKREENETKESISYSRDNFLRYNNNLLSSSSSAD